jgi:DNA-binding NarL/FixJ family response regulator/tetratricopeptide (TPR) repeat protein
VLGDTLGVSVTVDFHLVGREEELGRLEEFVAGVTEGPRAVVIRGEAGIGKTSLWRAGIDAAQRAGARVLLTRCAEAEMPLPLGGLSDLLETALPEIGDELAEPERRALAVAVGLEVPSEQTPGRVALPRAFLACVRTLAGHSPLILAIDDVQWLDPPSQRIVAFAARRLGESPVGMLVTQRGAAGDPLDLRRAFDERYAELRVSPMSVGALHHLIRTRLHLRIPRPTLARVHEASGGNPMFALELAQVAHYPGAPLPVPSTLEELVQARVAALPAEVIPLLAAVAAVERPTITLMAGVVDDAHALVDAAARSGAVTLGADGLIHFTHPLLASSAYAAIPAVARQALHAKLAAVSSDPEERARHVALSTFEPDPEAASLLDEAAGRARSRGAPDAAATLARHAIRLTPAGDVGAREQRALAVGTYLMDAAQMARAGEFLDDLLAGEITGTRRARALVLRILVGSDLLEGRRLAEEALQHAGDDAALRARVLLTLGTTPAQLGDFGGTESIVDEALAIAEDVGDPVLLATALGCAAMVAEVRGRPEPTLIERAVVLAGTRPPLQGFSSPRFVLAQLKLSLGDLAGARELLEAELEITRRWGHEDLTQRVLGSLFDLEFQAGNWHRAEQHLETYWRLAFDGDYRLNAAHVGRRQALLAAALGRDEEARRLALETIGRGAEFHFPWLAGVGRWVLGFLALSVDEPADAWDELRFLFQTLDPLGGAEPLQRGLLMLPDAIEAAVAVDRLEEAERLTSSLDEHARARKHRWATLAAKRCRALLLLARGESRAALTAAEAAASGFEAAGFPLDRGRALLVAGDALRRLGERRRAAEKLETAKTVFSELGAALWLRRAENELRRANPRPRRDRELTTAERRVAALVAGGRTNREVAAQLFTTVNTVETHLTRIYRKLGVRSRTELAREVADGTLELGDA